MCVGVCSCTCGSQRSTLAVILFVTGSLTDVEIYLSPVSASAVLNCKYVSLHLTYYSGAGD